MIKAFCQCTERMYSSTAALAAPKVPKVIVLGATSHIAGGVVLEALRRGCDVTGTSRRPDFKGLKPSTNLDLVVIPKDKVTDVATWKKFAAGVIKSGDDVLVVNAMGGAHPEEGLTLEDLNIHPVVAALEGIQTVAKIKGVERFHFLQFSSASTEVCADPYGDTKRKANKTILEMGPADTTILSVGYALSAPVRDGGKLLISNEHDYSPDQLAYMPLQIILGDGNVPIQPVALSDIAEVACNSLDYRGKETIFAVGPEIVTQTDLVKFFCTLMGRDFNPIDLPLDVATLIVKHFAKGHFAPYAVEAVSKGGIILPHGPFEARKGSSLLKLKDIYPVREGDEFVTVAPPIKAHLREVVRKIATDPGAARDSLLAIVRYLKYHAK